MDVDNVAYTIKSEKMNVKWADRTTPTHQMLSSKQRMFPMDTAGEYVLHGQ